MAFADGSGSILLQNFTLADGQICVRATFSWEGNTDTSSLSIYPREQYDWLAAADQIAAAWLAGQTPAKPAVQASSPTQEAGPAIEEVAAAG